MMLSTKVCELPLLVLWRRIYVCTALLTSARAAYTRPTLRVHNATLPLYILLSRVLTAPVRVGHSSDGLATLSGVALIGRRSCRLPSL